MSSCEAGGNTSYSKLKVFQGREREKKEGDLLGRDRRLRRKINKGLGQ